MACLPEPGSRGQGGLPAYAELYTISNFSFLRGASHPEELVRRAHELGYQAIAITDECSLSGVVRAHIEARKHGIQLIIGSEFRLEEGMRLVLLARALVKEPPLVILDEPCQGLDRAHRHRVLAILDQVAREPHSTVIYVTHHRAEIPASFGHELRLDRGRAAYCGVRRRAQ